MTGGQYAVFTDTFQHPEHDFIVPHLEWMIRKRVQLCQPNLYHGFFLWQYNSR